MMMSIAEKGRKKIAVHQDGDSDSSDTWQQCDDTVETVHSDLPEIAPSEHKTKTHTAIEGATTFEEVLQVHAPDLECTAPARTYRSPALLVTYYCRTLLIRQASEERLLDKYVPVAIRAHIF